MDTFLVVFVCTGNLCRSPMAEGIMKDLILDEVRSTGRNLPIKVTSAGTHAVTGFPPTENACAAAALHGIDISYKHSLSLSDSLIENADLILTMEKDHTRHICQYFGARLPVYELKAFGHEPKTLITGTDIDDPIGMSMDGYVRVFDEIYKELLRVKDTIFSLTKEKSQE